MLQPVWLPALMHVFLLVRHRSCFQYSPQSFCGCLAAAHEHLAPQHAWLLIRVVIVFCLWLQAFPSGLWCIAWLIGTYSMLSLCTASSSSTATVTHAIHDVYTCGCQNMAFLAKLIGALKLNVYAGKTIPGLSRILTLLSVASGHVNEGASQVTVEMRYKSRAAHHRLIDCKYTALCACAEELWPVLTAIDYSFECVNTDIPFDTEVRSIDCQAMMWVFACHA